MAKKLADYKDEEWEQQDSMIDAGRSAMKVAEQGGGRIRNWQFGICANCKNFDVVESEFKVLFARCCSINIRLNTKEPVKFCSAFMKRGEMSIYDMKQIAYLIDVPKDKIGFKTESEK